MSSIEEIKDLIRSTDSTLADPYDHDYHDLAEKAQKLVDYLSLEIADKEAAAGELLISIPEPGSDMGKLLHANIMMRKYQIPELENDIEGLNKVIVELGAKLEALTSLDLKNKYDLQTKATSLESRCKALEAENLKLKKDLE